MKKALFMFAAALVMGMTLAACGEKKANAAEGEEAQATEEVVIDETLDPGEQIQSLVMQYGDFLKAAHINSQEEADAFLAKALTFKEAIEKVSLDMQKKFEGMEEGDEKTAYGAAMVEIADNREAFKATIKEECARLKAEAEKAGANLEDFE